MREIGIRCAIAILVALLCASTAQAASCTLREVASLPIVSNPDGGIVVQVDLGDGKSRSFLVDAGSPQTFVLAHVADTLGLHRIGVPINPPYYAGKDHIDARIRIPAMKLDGAIVTDAVVDVIPEEQLNLVRHDDIDGILGDDVLALYDLEFDFTDGKINLFAPGSCPGHEVYWTQHFIKVPIGYGGGVFFFPVTIDGHEVAATLHTTGASTSMSSLAAHSAFKLSLASPAVTPVHAGDGALDIYGYPFQKLMLAELVMPNPQIDIVELSATKSLGQWRLAHAQDGGLVALLDQGGSVAQLDIHEDGGWKGPSESIYTYTVPTAQSFLALGTGNMQRLRMFVSFSDKYIYVSGAHAQQDNSKP